MSMRRSVAGVKLDKQITATKAKNIEKAAKLYHKGYKSKVVANALGLNIGTIHKWRHDHPELKPVLRPNPDATPDPKLYAALDRPTVFIEGREFADISEKMANKINIVLRHLNSGETMGQAIAAAKVADSTLARYRAKYPKLDELFEEAFDRSLEARRPDAIRTDLELRPKGTFSDFRMTYFGRPTLPHQQPIVQALEDRTNLVVIVLAPPGSGKDTIAGDWILYELADDRDGLRVAWIMESENFARRRLQRLAGYLTDPTMYKYQPAKTPGGSAPKRSLIEDYGPYRWDKELVFADGSKPERRPWNQNQMYFVLVETPEADPNLWATGVDGATYGARIDVAVLSDPFTEENQISPTTRANQMSFIEGTLDTRLDEGGRLIVLGTMLEGVNNYEKLLETYTANARVLHTDGIYTKYSNGTATVIHPAILYPNGEETSYWEDRFPLEPAIDVGDERFTLADLSDDEMRDLLAKPGAERIRGLRERRERNPHKFEAMYNQNRAGMDLADFTEETLAAAETTDRSFGTIYPNEVLVLGVDPARVYGAGWVLWAVDTHRNRATIADFFYGERLGYEGIKQKLIMNPVTQYNPAWLVYESNRYGDSLNDPVIEGFLKSSGVAVWTPHTSTYNRQSLEIGPASMTSFMRSKGIVIPYATSLDRKKADQLKAQFQAWDRSTKRRNRGARSTAPDDLAMAAWMGWLKVIELMDAGFFGGRPKVPHTKRPVPRSVQRTWNHANGASSSEPINRVSPSIDDAITIMAGAAHDESQRA